MRLSHFVAVLSSALAAAAAEAAPPPPPPPADTFHESLTLHPLPDGKLSVLFEFTTHFSLHDGGAGGRTREWLRAIGPADRLAQSHHALTPPTLLLPLARNRVSELAMSFTSGQWHQRRFGEAGPLHHESGGGGAEIRGWLADQGADATDRAWEDITQAFGGLFCAGIDSEKDSAPARSFGDLYPPARGTQNLTHYLDSNPHLRICTENLTPFLSLLPSKGVSGLSALLAQPGVVFAWGFKTEGIEVVMPTAGEQGRWTGWWEGVVDLVPERGGGRSFAITSLFKKPFPRIFPQAASSTLRVIYPADGDAFRVEPPPPAFRKEWIDGVVRDVAQWDLLRPELPGSDMAFWWDGEGHFAYPQDFTPPAITISRVTAERRASDATLLVTITNNAAVNRDVVYSEYWPWWVKGWLSEMTVRGGSRTKVLHSIDYQPSVPPTPSNTNLHLHLTLPARTSIVISIPFTKLTLKYNDHRPDAERGRELPPSVLTLLDLVGEGPADGAAAGERDPLRSARTRIFGPKVLLDVPTPDFSMPYNVIILSSTVMAVCFGSIQGRLVRRWGWIDRPAKAKTE